MESLIFTYEDYVCYFDILKKLIKEKYPDCIALILDEPSNIWDWGPIAQITIWCRDKTMHVNISCFAEPGTLDADMRNIFIKWAKHLKTVDQRHEERNDLIKRDLLLHHRMTPKA